MAQRPEKREDLLRDATAMPRRVMLRCALTEGEEPIEVFAGFRANGALSLYFDEDPAYHFNSDGTLRRAFVDDRIVMADEGRLAHWQRENGPERVEMLRHELTDPEQAALLGGLQSRLETLGGLLRSGGFETVGEVPEGGGVLRDLLTWLETHPSVEVAQAAGVS